MTTKESEKKATNVIAQLVDAGIKNSGKTASQIAKECRFNNPCFVSLMRKGHSRVPIKKLGDIARSIGLDVVNFRNRAVQAYLPDLWDLDMREGILPIGLTLKEQKAVRIMKLELDKGNLELDDKFFEDLRKIISDLKDRSQADVFKL